MKLTISFEVNYDKRGIRKSVSKQIETSQPNEEVLQQRLLLVNAWISNCDQKAGLILAATCVLLPIVTTTSELLGIAQKYIRMFIDLINTGSGSILSLLFILTLAMFIVALCVCILFLFRCLEGEIDTSIYSEDDLNTESLLFFQTIAKKPFKRYKKDVLQGNGNRMFEDYISQIYINSKICTIKFTNYNKGLKYLKWSLGLLVALFLQIIL